MVGCSLNSRNSNGTPLSAPRSRSRTRFSARTKPERRTAAPLPSDLPKCTGRRSPAPLSFAAGLRGIKPASGEAPYSTTYPRTRLSNSSTARLLGITVYSAAAAPFSTRAQTRSSLCRKVDSSRIRHTVCSAAAAPYSTRLQTCISSCQMGDSSGIRTAPQQM